MLLFGLRRSNHLEFDLEIKKKKKTTNRQGQEPGAATDCSQGFVLFNFQILHFVLSLLFDTWTKLFPVNEEMQILQV